MPSYWFLGYHLSRYGYQSTDEIRQVGQGMRDHGIQYVSIKINKDCFELQILLVILIILQDVQICDIDCYDNTRDFTVNQNGFSDLADFVDELHQYGQRYMPIVVRHCFL